MKEKTRVVFMGSARISCVALEALLKAPWLEVAGAVAQPDRPVGRNRGNTPPMPCPGKACAVEHGIPVITPARVNKPEVLSQIWAWAPDVIVVVSYGQILKAPLLNLPPLGCVNLHLSLLPKHRGAAPVKWAIADGDTRTGVTVMQMDEGMDTGCILAQSMEDILPGDTSETLTERLSKRGAILLVDTLRQLVKGTAEPVAQNSNEATYAPKLSKDDGWIAWDSKAKEIVQRIRAFQPWPGSCTFLPVKSGDTVRPTRVRIFRAEAVARPRGTGGACAGTVLAASDADGLLIAAESGAVRILEVQAEGGRRMSIGCFLRGRSVPVGGILPPPPPPAALSSSSSAPLELDAL
ncbi:MAG: methionyl-tRNA formyltransferase [Kiritimatiellia bacterium]|jgi:methionyl-tRNA formyltransferase